MIIGTVHVLCIYENQSEPTHSIVHCVYLCLEGFTVQLLSPGSGRCSFIFCTVLPSLFSPSAYTFGEDNLHRQFALSLLVGAHKVAHYYRGAQ